MDVTKPYTFIGFGAMDVTKPYEFIGFGAMGVTKPYNFIGFRCAPSPSFQHARQSLVRGPTNRQGEASRVLPEPPEPKVRHT